MTDCNPEFENDQFNAQRSNCLSELVKALVSKKIKSILQDYITIIKNIETRSDFTHLQTLRTVKYATKEIFNRLLVDTFYVGDQLAKILTQDLNLLMKIKKMIIKFQSKEDVKNTKNCQIVKYVPSKPVVLLQNDSILMSHLSKNLTNENCANLPSHLFGLNSVDLIDPVEAYKAYLSKNFILHKPSKTFPEFEQDDDMNEYHIYYSFLIMNQNKIFY